MARRIRDRTSWRPALLRLCGVLAACGALLLAGGCGAGGGTPTGTVTGLVLFGGGLGQPPGHSVPEAGVVNAFAQTGQLVAHQRVQAGQRFVFRLKVGRFSLNTGQDGRGCPPATVTVRSGRTARLDVETLCLAA